LRTLLAIGAIGELVTRIQAALTKAGFDTKGTDGWYGQNTANAVIAFQQANGLAATRVLDDVTWPALMQSPVPAVSQRSLQLTAAFEGHGFGLAVGNFDGALLTWGIIGFTLASGEIQQIVLAINSSVPPLIDQAFGDNKAELLQLMNASNSDQASWANAHTLPRSGRLVEPWRTMFATFGCFAEVQAEQLKHVQADYLTPAIQTAKQLGFTSELGLALAFDIHVQNGGIKNTALAKIQQQSTPGTAEADLRVIVANAVADSSRPAYMEDVRKRKLAIAQGQGQVHGQNYVLQNWGLDGSFPANELS
jgi:hypothetical protein